MRSRCSTSLCRSAAAWTRSASTSAPSAMTRIRSGSAALTTCWRSARRCLPTGGWWHAAGERQPSTGAVTAADPSPRRRGGGRHRRGRLGHPGAGRARGRAGARGRGRARQPADGRARDHRGQLSGGAGGLPGGRPGGGMRVRRRAATRSGPRSPRCWPAGSRRRRSSVAPDYVAAFLAAPRGSDVCIVAGTGSVVCSRADDGSFVVSGGRGWILGDHGGAARLGRAALEHYVTDPEEVPAGFTAAVAALTGGRDWRVGGPRGPRRAEPGAAAGPGRAAAHRGRGRRPGVGGTGTGRADDGAGGHRGPTYRAVSGRRAARGAGGAQRGSVGQPGRPVRADDLRCSGSAPAG